MFEEWRDPSANTIEELLSRELAVLKMGLDRREVVKVSLAFSSVSGRGLIATRDIHQGELILQETPAISGPKPSSDACCCLCGSKMTSLANIHLCAGCGLPTCGQTCSLAALHSRECKELKGFRFRSESMEDISKLALIITPLRCLLLQNTAPENWARVALLQDHLEERRTSKVMTMNQIFLIKFLREIGLDENQATDHDIQKVCGILDSNAFESLSARGEEVRTLYPLVAMCNSSCLPNATHVSTRQHQLRLVAARPIRQGEEIFVCYTGIRWGRTARRKHLQLTKHFLCQCLRCRDPTDRGTFISAIKCKDCGGNVIPLLDGYKISESEKEDEELWSCHSCSKSFTSKQVQAVEAILGQLLKLVRKDDSQTLEALIKKADKLVSKSHYVILELCMTLLNLYRQQAVNYERIANLSGNMLPVLETLEGESRALAFAKFALVEAQLNLYRAPTISIPEADWLKKCCENFKTAYRLLQFDNQAPENLEAVRKELESLEAQVIRSDGGSEKCNDNADRPSETPSLGSKSLCDGEEIILKMGGLSGCDKHQRDGNEAEEEERAASLNQKDLVPGRG